MNSPVLLFDGVCNLCNGLVIFILKNEKEPAIKFAALQSDAGIAILKKNNIQIEQGRETIIFIEDGKVLSRSRAAIKIANYLRKPYTYARFVAVLPVAITDLVYNLIAKTRYRFFGRQDQCMIPDAKWKDRFLN